MCKCKVCNRQFHYGDEWSPMFVEKIWWDLLDFYNLWRYEAEAEDTFYREYAKYKKGPRPTPFQDKDEYHCFICYECAEKALGRKLTLEDINDSMFNGPFKKFYFKQEQ